MNVINFFVFGILPFITILIFLGGMIYRIMIWSKLPAPGMTLFPKTSESTIVQVIKETFFFPGLFKTDKVFWGGAWIFHVMLALIFVGHVRVFTDFPALWAAMGMTAEGVDTMSAVSGGAAGVVIFIMTVFLLFRRLTVKRVKEITNAGDYIALLLVICILSTGNIMRFGEHFDLNLTRTYFGALFTFSAYSVPANTWFMIHFLLAQLLLIYIPFSKILHFGGIFFSHHALRRV